jgi:hypothetical protein
MKYLTTLSIIEILVGDFAWLKKSSKGAKVAELFKQVLCFFFDGTNLSMTRFDELKGDRGYAGVIESREEELLSSHTAKRFFKAFGLGCTPVFRRILRRLFIWRLKLEQPAVIEITIDSMVMDNDDAVKRHGVQPTYKKVKGFQPLHAIWNGQIVDAIFRGGKRHGNAGNCVVVMVRELTRLIRKEYRYPFTIALGPAPSGGAFVSCKCKGVTTLTVHKNSQPRSGAVRKWRSNCKLLRHLSHYPVNGYEYSETVMIVVRIDAGFFDQENFKEFDELGVGFIGTGKLYKDVKATVAAIPEDEWKEYRTTQQTWQYAEWDYSAESWSNQSYRALYTRPVYEANGQGVLEFSRPENMIVTNLRENDPVLKHCTKAQKKQLISPLSIIESHHQRGADELPHRGLKDFGTEQLPFKRFAPNAAFYYLMVVGYVLFCCFQRDVLAETHSELTQAYPEKVRRTLIDVAVKVVRRARQVFLKMARAVFDTLKFDELWKRVTAVPLVPI